MSSFDKMPPLYIPKKRKAVDIPDLEERDQLDKDTKQGKKKLKARESIKNTGETPQKSSSSICARLESYATIFFFFAIRRPVIRWAEDRRSEEAV